MKFQVLRPIEHNQKLYVPKGYQAPEKVKSFGSGQEIPVDNSGTIELNDKEAALLGSGEIQRAGGQVTSEAGVSGVAGSRE